MPAFTPQEIHVLFERAYNSGNVEDIVALNEPGAVLVSGHEGLRIPNAAFLASGARMNFDTRAVIESGEGLAVLHGAWSLGPPSGTQGLNTEGVSRQPAGSSMFVIDNPNTPR